MAAAWALGLSVDDICMGIAYARPAKRRSEMRLLGGLKVIDDCYNANPVSMVAALDALAEAHRSARAVAVLGDMLELGPDELAMHAEVGAHAATTGLFALIAVGERARALAGAARKAGLAQVYETDDPAWAARKVRELTSPNDWLLVKASRGTRLERVLDELSALHKAAQRTSGGAN
jgi:UDP-N-acetylmuramyl pentapeptide synthase